MAHVRRAVGQFFNAQREKYGEGLTNLGVELFTGKGGFHHWGRLPVFGPLGPDSFDDDMKILKQCID